MRDRPLCQARVNSREFGEGMCCNYAKAERFGLRVCNVHKNLIDREADGLGDEYALMIARQTWKRPEAALPRVRPEVLA
jgi:hypothetical protein